MREGNETHDVRADPGDRSGAAYVNADGGAKQYCEYGDHVFVAE